MRATWAVVYAVWATLVYPAHAQPRDDPDTPDDLPGADYPDDGQPMGSEDPEAICNLRSPVDISLDWTLGGTAELTLPPAGAGNSWTIEYRASGRDVDLAWVESNQGSPTSDTTYTLVPPPTVAAAAAATPLLVTARASARDATDAEIDMRYPGWLIVDAGSGVVEYEHWEDHEWPTLTNEAGETFVVAELDWDPNIAISTTTDDGGSTFFPVELDGNVTRAVPWFRSPSALTFKCNSNILWSRP